MEVSRLGKMPIGPVQGHVRPTVLRRILQLLKERETMLLFKFSKEELDKGKKAEMRDKVGVQSIGKQEYSQIQRERYELKRLDRLSGRVQQLLQEFFDQVRFGLFGELKGE